MSERYLIIGLGNPGPEYAKTRHNIGFMVVEELARRWQLTFGKTTRKAQIAAGIGGGKRVLLAKPQTYMNESGQAVRRLVDFYQIELAQLIVIHDDLDLPLGALRLRSAGSAGGQKGVKSIIDHLGVPEFSRVRCGIGRPPGVMDPADYVLHPFSGDEAITARIVVEHAADAVETWLQEGIDLAMTRHNGPVELP